MLLISYFLVPSLFETNIRNSGLLLKLLSMLSISKLKIYPGTSIYLSICLNAKTVVHSLQFLAIKPECLSSSTLILQVGSGKLINSSLTWIMWSFVPFMEVFADKITGGPKMKTWNIQISLKKLDFFMAAFQLLFTFFVKEKYNRLNSHKACKIVPHLRLNI